jgi:hypothetical protein
VAVSALDGQEIRTNDFAIDLHAVRLVIARRLPRLETHVAKGAVLHCKIVRL